MDSIILLVFNVDVGYMDAKEMVCAGVWSIWNVAMQHNELCSTVYSGSPFTVLLMQLKSMVTSVKCSDKCTRLCFYYVTQWLKQNWNRAFIDIVFLRFLSSLRCTFSFSFSIVICNLASALSSTNWNWHIH